MWKFCVALAERSEVLIQKADTSDKCVEEARAAQEELGKPRESLAAERDLTAAAKLQTGDGISSVMNCGPARKS